MKRNVLLASTVISLAAAGLLLTSCGESSSVVDVIDNTINVQLVPSQDPGKLATLAPQIEPLLNKTSSKYKFKITVGTTYAAATEALVSNQVEAAFLTASGYAQATIQNPGKIEVNMTAVRKGYKVQVDDYKGNVANQIKAMNGEIEGYTYRGEQSDTDVNFYTSQLSVRAEKYVDANKDGKIDIKDMAGLKIGRMGATSGAGYLRPLKYLADNGMTMVDTITDATTQIQGIDYGKAGYPAAYEAMQNGDIDGFWGYTDVRYSAGYNSSTSQYYHKDEAFTLSKVAAITDGIYNDTISVRSNAPQEVKDAINTAFKTVIKEGDKNTEGTGAYLMYNIYSHTGYMDAKDSDFDGERAFYKYCVDNNLIK